ncbi:Alkaline phosphatase [hydrothermal vent metagenome]|uniref:Alkaline phosphatase n=1 Tax=hydrothermal vent metagenome TaxID=652676 RepID=A0A3B1CH89_9ZZZZ
MSQLTHYKYGACYNVSVNGNYAYYSDGSYLKILDISTPTNPVEKGELLLPRPIVNMKSMDSYVYVADSWDGFIIIDVSDPNNPVEMSTTKLGNVVDFDLNVDSTAIVVSGSGGIYSVDISDPANPVQLYHAAESGWANSVTINDNYAYIALQSPNKIVQYEISYPDSIYPNKNVDLSNFPNNLKIDGQYLFVTTSLGLRIIDVLDPAGLTLKGFFTASQSWELDYNGNYVFITTPTSVKIINVSDKMNPVQTGSFEVTPSNPASVAVMGNYVYSAIKTGLRIDDVSNLAFPVEVKFVSTGGISFDMDVNGNYAYLIHSPGDFSIFNIADPSNPVKLSSLGTENYFDIKIQNNYAYLLAGNNDLQILNISDPSNPTEVSRKTFFGISRGIAVSGDYLYVADNSTAHGFQIIDISDPANPVLSGSIDSISCNSVTVLGNYAYLAEANSTVRVIDISDPTNPTQIGSLSIDGVPLNIESSGNYAYVVSGTNGLRIIDISNPSNPAEVGFFKNDDYFMDAKVVYPYVYIADGYGYVRIVDVTNPASPNEVGVFATGYQPTGIAVDNNLIFVPAEKNGFYILNNDLLVSVKSKTNEIPRNFLLSQNYPNPFNPTTVISYSLPESGFVSMKMYDILGNEVAVLVNEYKPTGNYSIEFNGNDLSSGVYIYQMQAGSFIDTKKLMLLK